MSEIPIGRDDVATALRYLAGVAELTSRFGSEITSLVQEVHAASSPLSMLSASAPVRGIYGSIRFGFTAAGRLAALGGQLLPQELAADSWLDLQSLGERSLRASLRRLGQRIRLADVAPARA